MMGADSLVILAGVTLKRGAAKPPFLAVKGRGGTKALVASSVAARAA